MEETQPSAVAAEEMMKEEEPVAEDTGKIVADPEKWKACMEWFDNCTANCKSPEKCDCLGCDTMEYFATPVADGSVLGRLDRSAVEKAMGIMFFSAMLKTKQMEEEQEKLMVEAITAAMKNSTLSVQRARHEEESIEWEAKYRLAVLGTKFTEEALAVEKEAVKRHRGAVVGTSSSCCPTVLHFGLNRCNNK